MANTHLFCRVLVTAVATLGIVSAAGVRAAEPVSGDLLADAEVAFGLAAEGAAPVWGERLSFAEPGEQRVFVKATFHVPAPTPFAALELDGFPGGAYELNGQAVPVARKGIFYTTVRGIPPSLLKPGTNVLTGAWRLQLVPKTNATGQVRYMPIRALVQRADGKPNRFTESNRIVGYPYNAKSGGLAYRRITAPPVLRGLMPDALAFQTGPVLGCASHEMFTVYCRVNMPAAVKLEVAGRTFRSEPGRHHSFEVKGLSPATAYAYTVTATGPAGHSVTTGPYTVRTFPVRGPLTFAAMGDSRSCTRRWRKIAGLVLELRPLFLVFTGDLVYDGTMDALWDVTFITPAQELFATTPCYAVPGNHERGTPLLTEFFGQPGAEQLVLNQELGLVHLVGPHVNRRLDTAARTKHLERILSRSRAPYIFFATHWPALSSGRGGGMRRSKLLLPTLQNCGATAMLAGHHHQYERSEPRGGPTVIVTGAAGAGGRADDRNRDGNPDSKVLVGARHFCLFTVEPDRCIMTAIDEDGTVIDTRQWAPPRRVTPPAP